MDLFITSKLATHYGFQEEKKNLNGYQNILGVFYLGNKKGRKN